MSRPTPLLSHPPHDDLPSGRPLSRHLDEVGRIAALVLDRHPVGAFASTGIDAGQVLMALAGWHDIAKGTRFFQEYIANPDAFRHRASRGDPDANPQLKTHTPLGAVLAMRRWSDGGWRGESTEITPRLLGLLMMIAVRGHHGHLPSREDLRKTLEFEHLAEQLVNLHAEVEGSHPSLAGALAGLADTPIKELTDEVRDQLDGAFDELDDQFCLDDRIRFRLAVQFCFSCLLEADKAILIHGDEAKYRGNPGREIAPTTVEGHPPSGGSAPEIDRQRGRALAEVIAEADGADLADLRPRILTLPTGLGKTRCAAAWAFHLRHRMEERTGVRLKVLVVLPFLSIIEQTAKVYREILEIESDGNDETLAVSHSLAVRDYGDLEADDRAEFCLDTWRSDIILTTFDQFLLALMDARAKNQQRFHNLCDAIIVLDEVQAFPCHLWHPVGHVLRGLAEAGRSRLLLMTATQPGLIDANRCEAVIRDPATYRQSRYRLVYDPTERLLSDLLPEMAEEIRRAENFGIAKWLIVLNTRNAAREAYEYFREAPPREQLFLLSSDIVPKHRLGRIGEIRESSSCLVISTQCVEAGVDLDMDRVIRDFGPLDSLVQVAGRCNRHGSRPRAEVRIVRLRDDRQRYCDYIYDLTLLEETGASLRCGKIDEEDMAEVVEDYFRRLHRRKDLGLQTTKSWSKFDHDDLHLAQLLRGDQKQVSFVVGKLDPGLRDDVKKALDLPDRWVRRRELRRLAPRIASVTVSVWKTPKYIPSDIADPVPAGSETPIFWFLHDNVYDEEVGLCPPKAASQYLL